MWKILKKHVVDYYVKVMQISDSPTKIAQGIALGTALDFLPIPVISIPVAYILARILRFNAIAAVLAAVFFKWAVPFFYAFNLLVGNLILQGNVTQLILPQISYYTVLMVIREWSYPFFVGCAVNFTVSALLMYYIFHYVLELRQRQLRRRCSTEDTKQQ